MALYLWNIGHWTTSWCLMSVGCLLTRKRMYGQNSCCLSRVYYSTCSLRSVRSVSNLLGGAASIFDVFSSKSPCPTQKLHEYFVEYFLTVNSKDTDTSIQHCRLNICWYIGWIGKYCICQFNQYNYKYWDASAVYYWRLPVSRYRQTKWDHMVERIDGLFLDL